MTKEQIAELRRLDCAPDGSCWYCKTVMKGHFPGCPVELFPRLLDERETLLVAAREAMLLEQMEGDHAEDVWLLLKEAIAKAEAP